MKKYKLLKEISWVKEWLIIKVWKENQHTTVWDIIDGTDNQIQKIQELFELYDYNYIKLIKDWWFEEIKDRIENIYELEENDFYWYINAECIVKEVLADKINLQRHLECWNVFLTEEEAKKELSKRKALTNIRKWIIKNWYEKFIYTWWKNKDIAEICYNINTDKIFVDSWNEIRVNPYISFTSRMVAEACAAECKKEWEVLFDIK